MKFDKLKVYDNFYWKRVSGVKLIGKYDMPVLKPVHNVVPRNLVPFHSAKNCPPPKRIGIIIMKMITNSSVSGIVPKNIFQYWNVSRGELAQITVSI